ncbi:MAG TPA: hypothetical protein VK363_12835 [Pyrinomonadaceae bacterium]|nr:hypothetical protein [Pyrinomonadaceae bacterium]
MQPDALAAAEKTQLENEELRAKVEQIYQTLKTNLDVHGLRIEYLTKLFRLIVGWLIVVICFVTASSLKWIVLSDSVLIAFITSTTVSVLGLFMLAAKWLFNAPHKDEKKE